MVGQEAASGLVNRLNKYGASRRREQDSSFRRAAGQPAAAARQQSANDAARQPVGQPAIGGSSSSQPVGQPAASQRARNRASQSANRGVLLGVACYEFPGGNQVDGSPPATIAYVSHITTNIAATLCVSIPSILLSWEI